MNQTTTHGFGTHPAAVNDPELRESLRVIDRTRKTKFALMIGGIVAAIVALLVLTTLMYSQTPAEIPAGRIGTDTFQTQ